MNYVELHARSAFSFLRGSAQPEDLMRTAANLGLGAIAVCDRNGVYGSARCHAAGKEAGIRSITGAELTMEDGTVLPVLVATRQGYKNLCQLVTRSKLRGTKHESSVRWSELPEFADGLIALTGDEEGPVASRIDADQFADAESALSRIVSAFGSHNVCVEIQRHSQREDRPRNAALIDLAHAAKLPLLATNGVRYAVASQRPLLDVFTCARHHTHLDAAGRLLSNHDHHRIKNAAEMSALFADHPQAVTNTMHVAERIEFTLEDLGYEFPRYQGMEDGEMNEMLRRVTFAGARARYSHLSPDILRQINHELDIITRLGFAGYFLIVWDLANFCSEQNILMQGRGSAANSAVCYSLGITACDPIGYKLLFERFLSEGRTSWPDIDLDLPSGDRRERVIQEVYQRYGEHGAAMTANVITYRGKSAMREVGKALNFPPETLNRYSKLFASGDFPHTLELEEQMRKAGMPVNSPRTKAAVALYERIYGLPRHLGQHSGGMIICQGALSSVVPLERASMEGRVVAQWDKDDCNDLGIIKVDLLGLGMMAVLQDSLEACRERGRPVDLAKIPNDDPATYEMLREADTIGVFQVESRAQMATLPRLKPERFYDLVVEVAIIRPGPIQGNMVHPYLARRAGDERVTYFDERLKPVLERTLGVPLFQEQLLKMAMVMADFSGSEAEELRRALSFHRSIERMEKVCVKLRAGMERNGVECEIRNRVVEAVQSFAVYGFPESHAISFAMIAYASAWLKVHRGPEFYTGLLNNQPMGFYSPATLVRDAKARGVQVRPVCIARSDWFCRIEDDGAIRLGFCTVRGMQRDDTALMLLERETAPFDSIVDFKRRSRLNRNVERTLARIGALNALAEHRRDALWKVEAPARADDLFDREPPPEAGLVPMNAVERLNADLHGTGMTTGPHAMKIIRHKLDGIWKAADLKTARNGQRIQIAGMVICRQRPGTAKGFVFVSLEDETGVANAIVTPQLFEAKRLVITQEPFLLIRGTVQNHENVIHVKAAVIEPLHTADLAASASHDFH